MNTKPDSESGQSEQKITAENGSTIRDVRQIAGDYHEHHHYSAAPPQTEPSNLPQKTYHHLVGRTEEQTTLLNALREPDSKRVVLIVGMGGIGKTALARELAEQCQAEKRFTHVVWSSAKTEHFVGGRTIEQGAIAFDLDVVLSDIGRQCDRVDIAKMPIDQKKTAVAHLLSTTPILIVLDNLETVPNYDDLIQQLTEMLGQSKLLITSRHEISYDQAFVFKLHGFSEEDGVAFIKTEGRERNITAVADAPFKTLLEIHETTGGAPLAIKLVVGQLSRHPMAVVLDALRQVSASNQDYAFYRFVYWHSWNLLDDNGKMALVDMSVFPPMIGGATVDVEAVSQLDTNSFWSAISQLVTMSLVDKLGMAGQERYALHALTHYFILADITKEWVGK